MRLIRLAVVLALGLTLMSVAAEAQQAGKVWRIGFLFFGAPGELLHQEGHFFIVEL